MIWPDQLTRRLVFAVLLHILSTDALREYLGRSIPAKWLFLRFHTWS